MDKKKLVAGAAAAMVVIGAGGAAYAASSDSSERVAGSNIEKAKGVALDHTNGGRVTGTEIGDEEGAYEVEVTREDGSQVDVHLDRDLNVLSTPTDHEGSPDGQDAPNDGGG